MTAVSPVVKPISQMQLTPGSVPTIQNVSWDEFELILQELGEKRISRVAERGSTLNLIPVLPFQMSLSLASFQLQ
ncbi:MAG: hypothetical protein JO235_00840 [Chroococcidiopsidaceae cyanobacterium CP_BM_RX_35]|nr:hypothetical protein [Chroococcidiopsidaceae cyanobacterium CP_BM_RX_35]